MTPHSPPPTEATPTPRRDERPPSDLMSLIKDWRWQLPLVAHKRTIEDTNGTEIADCMDQRIAEVFTAIFNAYAAAPASASR
jgi:hypothetical protein